MKLINYLSHVSTELFGSAGCLPMAEDRGGSKNRPKVQPQARNTFECGGVGGCYWKILSICSRVSDVTGK